MTNKIVEEKNNAAILAIVAVVAVVGIISLFAGGKIVTMPAATTTAPTSVYLSTDSSNIGGDAIKYGATIPRLTTVTKTMQQCIGFCPSNSTLINESCYIYQGSGYNWTNATYCGGYVTCANSTGIFYEPCDWYYIATKKYN